MKALLALILLSTTAAADISVCVNTKSGKARFSTSCTSKETQQYVMTGVGANGPIRTITAKVVVPKGTEPERQPTKNQFEPNYIAQVACADDEIYLRNYEDGTVTNTNIHNYCEFEPIVIKEGDEWEGDWEKVGVRVYCGGSSNLTSPTTADMTVYLVAACLKK